MRLGIIAVSVIISLPAFAFPDAPLPPFEIEGRWVDQLHKCTSTENADHYNSLIIDGYTIQQRDLWCEDIKWTPPKTTNSYVMYRAKAKCSSEYMRKRDQPPVLTKIIIKLSDDGLSFKVTGENDSNSYIIKCDK